MFSRTLVLSMSVLLAARGEAQSPGHEAIMACKNAALTEVLRAKQPDISVVRFPPGAVARRHSADEILVAGKGEYRLGSDGPFQEFTYDCTYQIRPAKRRVLVNYERPAARTAERPVAVEDAGAPIRTPLKRAP